MFQTFDATTTPETGKPRLVALRQAMADSGVDGFLIPRSDAHMGEYVADRDQRLAWLTSFTGSAGYCAVTANRAALFADGRYTIQAADEIDTDAFEICNIPSDRLIDWLNDALPQNAKMAYDPWLHTSAQIDDLEKNKRADITLIAADNLVDAIWHDQPAAPLDVMVPHELKYAGQSHTEKLNAIGADLSDADTHHAVLTQPDSIAWALNSRGSDLGQLPVALCFAIIDAAGQATLFIDPAKVDETLRSHLGSQVTIKDVAEFENTLTSLEGNVSITPATAPIAVRDLLRNANVVEAKDPTTLPKACKNETELTGAIAAHVRDGAAVCEFLAYVASLGNTPDVSEIDLVKKLETCRCETGALRDISFETICGSGPNGAIVHYRVNEKTNRRIKSGDVLLVDSGGQYLDGTTDITRTIAIGDVGAEAIRANTLVLKGMINISKLRFPKGLSGRDIDPIARQFLWSAGMDFDHGTGHGVGSFLSVHEGPQGISRRSMTPLNEGMIVSNEPGYYKQDAFGIRIENLIYVKKATAMAGADDRQMLEFETLTLAPIDRAMIDVDLLTNAEGDWLNAYHQTVFDTLGTLVSKDTKSWLTKACAPL